MKRAAIVSFLIHALVLIVAYIGMGDPFRFNRNEPPAMVIDFDAVGLKSAAKKLSPFNEKKADALKTPEIKKPTDTTPPPVEELKEQEKSSPPPEPAKVEPPKEEPVKPEPETKKPKAKQDDKDVVKLGKKDPKKLDKKPEDTKEKKDDKKPTKKTKPEDKKKPEKKKKEKPKKSTKADDAALINLKKAKKTDKNKKIDSKAKSAEQALDDLMDNLTDQEGGTEAGSPAESVGDMLTATEIQAVVSTISKCWNIQAGTRGVMDTPVYVTLHMNEDGTVAKAEIEDTRRLATDPIFRTAAESAKRAALDPMCNPLPLSPKRYNNWKTLQLDFNPKMMAENLTNP
jgi:hypothetical protein